MRNSVERTETQCFEVFISKNILPPPEHLVLDSISLVPPYRNAAIVFLLSRSLEKFENAACRMDASWIKIYILRRGEEERWFWRFSCGVEKERR